MNYLAFYIVILLANVIQGITGFAGTILAMPPSLMLVGYDVAKPVLNVLGLLSGVYVLLGHWRHVWWKEFLRIVAVMAAGILAGIWLKTFFIGREQLLYQLLGIFVILLSVQGLHKALMKDGAAAQPEAVPAGRESGAGVETPAQGSAGSCALLAAAGIVHGMFVSGGPLLIGYLTRRIRDKVSFRSTISTVWVVLNTIILADDIRSGLWNPQLMKVQAIAVPFLLAGMYAGSRLYAIMSQRLFMIITYVLLLISGASLLIK